MNSAIKKVAFLIPTLLSTASVSAAQVNAENPIQVVCMDESPWLSEVGSYVRYENGQLHVYKVKGDVTQIATINRDACTIEPNYVVDGDPSMGVEN